MPPKRANKGVGSSNAGAGAGRSGIVNPASYTDYDEAMEDGVELEEKGERFQFGPKAQRFYQQAGQLYLRAAALAPTTSGSHQAADALYNASRIQFLLGTQFYYVPQNVFSIAESVYTSSQALHKLNQPALPLRQDGEPGQLADPFLLDVVTARATAYQCLAELLDEVGGWPSDQARQLAGTSALTAEDDDETSRTGSFYTPIKLWHTAHEAFESVAFAQHAILVDQQISTDDDGADVSASAEAEPMAETPVDKVPNGDDIYGYTSSLVTTVSLIDSQLASLACLTSLVQSARSSQSAQEWDARAKASCALTESWMTSNSQLPSIADEKEQVEKEQELLRAQLSLRTTLLGKAVELFAKGQNASDVGSIQAQVQSAMEYVHDWSNRLLDPTPGLASGMKPKVDVATLCDVSEAGQTLCRLGLRLLFASADSTNAAQAIWTLATLSTKLYSSALSALDTSSGSGSAAVLGQANTSTPTSRARCRILMALSSLSLFRSSVLFEQSGVQGALGTRTKLVDNARLYARKAVTEIGLSALLRPPTQGSPQTLPPGGWDSLTLQADSLFVLLRSLLHRYKIGAATDNPSVETLQHELSRCLAHLVQLQHTAITNDAGMDVAVWLYQKGLVTFVDQIVDENGVQLCQQEAEWWQEVFTQINAQTQ